MIGKPSILQIGGVAIVISEVEGYYTEVNPFNRDEFRFAFSMKSGNKITTSYFLRSQYVKWKRIIARKFTIKSISKSEYELGL